MVPAHSVVCLPVYVDDLCIFLWGAMSHGTLGRHSYGRHSPRSRQMPSTSRPAPVQRQFRSVGQNRSSRRNSRNLYWLGSNLRRLLRSRSRQIRILRSLQALLLRGCGRRGRSEMEDFDLLGRLCFCRVYCRCWSLSLRGRQSSYADHHSPSLYGYLVWNQLYHCKGGHRRVSSELSLERKLN